MADDGTIKIGTELDNSGLKGGLSGLGGIAKKGMAAVGSAAAGMASITVGALAAVATGMGVAVKSGIEYNAQMENYTANFKTMLGSEEAAVAKVNELKKLGASTPFEMSDLADATTTLLAFGVEADDSTGILTMLGDVSLGSADKLQRLTNAFGKAESLGKMTGETYQQMVEAGFNPLKIISEQTGESMEELQDRMSKGGISAEELTAAFKIATSEGGQFYKGMETASTTFDGLISTLKDNANSLIGEVVKPISDSLTTTLLPQAIGAVSTLTDAFAKDGIPGLINAAGGVVGQIITGIAQQAPAIIQMASGFLSTLLNAIILQLPALASAGTGIITELVNAITANLPLLLQIALTLIVALVTALITQLPAIISCGLDLLVALIQGLTDALPKLIEMLPGIIISIVDTLLAHLPEIIQCAIQLLVALITGLSQAMPQMVAYLPKIIATIVKILVQNLPMIIGAAIQIITALITGLIQSIPTLIGAVPEIINAIKDAFKGFDWSTLGKNIIDGIKKGITDAAGKLGDAAKEAAQKALDTVKNFLGIHSPSRVWNKQIGRQMPAGAANGVEDNAYLLEDASVDSAESALRAAQSASSGMLAQMQGQAYGRTQGLTGASVGAVTAKTSANGSDSTLIGKEIAKALDGSEVKMDGQTVGRLVTPYVDEELGNISSLKARYA